jgi:hypothetical protein
VPQLADVVATPQNPLMVEPWPDPDQQMTTGPAATGVEVAEYVTSHRTRVPEAMKSDEEREADRIVKSIPGLPGRLSR